MYLFLFPPVPRQPRRNIWATLNSRRPLHDITANKVKHTNCSQAPQLLGSQTNISYNIVASEISGPVVSRRRDGLRHLEKREEKVVRATAEIMNSTSSQNSHATRMMSATIHSPLETNHLRLSPILYRKRFAVWALLCGGQEHHSLAHALRSRPIAKRGTGSAAMNELVQSELSRSASDDFQ
jgi:hypothetical protein